MLSTITNFLLPFCQDPFTSKINDHYSACMVFYFYSIFLVLLHNFKYNPIKWLIRTFKSKYNFFLQLFNEIIREYSPQKPIYQHKNINETNHLLSPSRINIKTHTNNISLDYFESTSAFVIENFE